MSTRNWGFETRQIHAGQTPDSATGARALPIYQTTAYQFDDAEQAASRFALAEFGPIYTRITNPTTEVVENRIADLEGGVGALLVASGSAATQLVALNLAGAGDHIVASSSLYGGTFNLFKYTLAKLGITTTFVTDPSDLVEWESAIQPNTKFLFAETVPNPRSDLVDLRAVSEVAHRSGVPFVVDNTVATPYLLRPIEHGADIVVHSATKYLGGHGTALGGAIVDAGRFDYAAHPERFPDFNTPDPSYHGLVYARDLGVGSALGANLAFILKARVQLLRDLGPAISPFNAFLLAQGIETLSLRMDRHVANADAVANWLESRPEVAHVNYAALENSPYRALADEYFPRGVGGVLSFELAGDTPEELRERGQKFVSGLRLHSHVANIGDVRSLVIHPASTTHSQLTAEEQAYSGVGPGLVRLAVGLESLPDILADLELGFEALG